MKIVVLLQEHLFAVSKLHVSAFPNSALTHLGHESVRRYYEWQLIGPHDCLAIGAFDDSGRLLGFCFGGVFRGALSGFLQKNRKFLILQVLKRPWLMVTNSIFRDRVRIGLSVSRKPKQPAVRSSQPTAERRFGILSIAVDPKAQGQGIGQLLMQHSEDYARQSGFNTMGLTVAVDNQQAIRFYEKSGWVKTSPGAAWKGSMVKSI